MGRGWKRVPDCVRYVWVCAWLWWGLHVLYISTCVCVCVYDGQLPSIILICQCNSLASLIFNKAPREPQTSSSELSVCCWLLNKAHSLWQTGPGEGIQPKCSRHESCLLLWTNGQFFVTQTLKCRDPTVRGLVSISEHRQVKVRKSKVWK